MTTPSPITRGLSNPAYAKTPGVLSLDLDPRYVIVDIGEDPLPDVEPENDGSYDPMASDHLTVWQASDAQHRARHALAVMQAMHDRDAAPAPHPLDGLGVGSIANDAERSMWWRCSSPGEWSMLDEGANPPTHHTRGLPKSDSCRVCWREPADGPTPAGVLIEPPAITTSTLRDPGPDPRAPHLHPGDVVNDEPGQGWQVTHPARGDYVCGPRGWGHVAAHRWQGNADFGGPVTLVAFHADHADLPEPAIGRRPYRVGNVIASSDEPEPPRTAVLRHAGEEDAGDTDRMMYGTRGWGWHGWRFGWSWKRMDGFPVTVVSL